MFCSYSFIFILLFAFFFFFNDTATTEIYTLSLHDALPISPLPAVSPEARSRARSPWPCHAPRVPRARSGGSDRPARRRPARSDRSRVGESERAQLEGGRELRSRLAHEEASAGFDLLEREL